jgi:hypothetical protein
MQELLKLAIPGESVRRGMRELILVQVVQVL